MPSGSNHDNGNDQKNNFQDVTDNISIAAEGSEADEIFKDTPLDFIPAYQPMV